MGVRICRNCKYWGVQYSFVCDRICLVEEEDAFSEAKQEIKPSANINAYASDDTGLVADFVCGPDFGCALFEEK